MKRQTPKLALSSRTPCLGGALEQSRAPSLALVRGAHPGVPLRTLLLAVAALSLTSIACSSSEPRSVAPDELERSIAEALCQQVRECAQSRAGSELTLLALSPSFADRCPDLVGREIGSLGYLLDLVEAGRVVYDSQAAARCLEEVAATCSLEGGFEISPACRDTFRGTAELGEDCSVTDECVPGSFCNAENVMDVCEGVCVARLPVGALCQDGNECARVEGTGVASCRTNGSPDRVCVSLEIRTGLAEGALCGDLVSGGLQQAYGLCAAEFFCDDPDRDDVGTCTRPIAVGSPCVPGQQACEEGALCLDLSSQPQCVAMTVVTTAGSPCDDQTLVCDYVAGLSCESGQCVAAAAGSCQEFFHCGPGEYCDGTSDLCAPLKANGVECQSSSECLSDTCRDDGTMSGTRVCGERSRCG